MANFTISLKDEKQNYKVIQFLSILAKGINANSHESSVIERTSDDGKIYEFYALNFTDGQLDALRNCLVEICKRPDVEDKIEIQTAGPA